MPCHAAQSEGGSWAADKKNQIVWLQFRNEPDPSLPQLSVLNIIHMSSPILLPLYDNRNSKKKQQIHIYSIGAEAEKSLCILY